ncbi:hypothetical protein Scep_001116 [Stephania cephalantha]|uniref:DUF4283 domain-containing protein n=1 Tax=Stephania cephalantha TaxID=152367 RepID=A0AAP0Q3I1_9MAGN
MDSFDLGKLVDVLDETHATKLTMEKEVHAVGRAKIKLSLVRKIFGIRQVNREGFMTTIKRVWNTANGFDVKHIAKENTFVFYFISEEDRERAHKGGPWSFDNHFIVLTKPHPVGLLDSLDFTQIPIWIQIHKAPSACMTANAARFLGLQIGPVEEIDLGSLRDCRKVSPCSSSH